MEVQGTELQPIDTATLLITMEQASLDAYRAKDENLFRKNLADDYVGISDDGFSSADDDVVVMKQFDLNVLDSKDQKLSFPTPDTGILTYTMMAEGTFDGTEIATTIYTSTVYVKRDGHWEAVLHNESIAR